MLTVIVGVNMLYVKNMFTFFRCWAEKKTFPKFGFSPYTVVADALECYLSISAYKFLPAVEVKNLVSSFLVSMMYISYVGIYQ